MLNLIDEIAFRVQEAEEWLEDRMPILMIVLIIWVALVFFNFFGGFQWLGSLIAR